MLPYWLHLPRGYNESRQPWPLVLFLHGSEERGADLAHVKRVGLPKQVLEHPAGLPFVLVAPLCPPRTWWAPHHRDLLAILDDVAQHHRIDPARVYLTGISMGGYGTWELAAAHPERFAAIVPICGGGRTRLGFPERVFALMGMPIWAFHGLRDGSVPASETTSLIALLRARGGDPRCTVYPRGGHDVWTRTYNRKDLYRWLLLQHRVVGPDANDAR